METVFRDGCDRSDACAMTLQRARVRACILAGPRRLASLARALSRSATSLNQLFDAERFVALGGRFPKPDPQVRQARNWVPSHTWKPRPHVAVKKLARRPGVRPGFAGGGGRMYLPPGLPEAQGPAPLVERGAGRRKFVTVNGRDGVRGGHGEEA